MTSKEQVAVIGSDVIGLTTAFCLQRTGRYEVTVAARDLIDENIVADPSQAWASPFAGANWYPSSDFSDMDGRLAEEFEVRKLRDLATTDKASGVQIVDMLDFGMYGEKRPRHALYQGYVHNLEQIDKSQWAKNAKYGYKFESLTFNVPTYLDWLK